MKHFVIGLLSALTLSAAAPAMAQHHHGPRHFGHHHHRVWHPGYGWIVPAVIGGAVVYAATRPETVIVQQPAPVVVQPNQVVIDGVVYTKQIMILNGVQTEVLVKN